MGFIPEITCRRCGNKYSAIHSRCPSCGAPRKQTQSAPRTAAPGAAGPNGEPAARLAAARPASGSGRAAGGKAAALFNSNTKWQFIFGCILIVLVIVAVIVLISASLGPASKPVETPEPTVEVTPPPTPSPTPTPTPEPTIPVTSISITFLSSPLKEFTQRIGADPIQLKAEVYPVEAVATAKLEWRSSDESIITVDDTGLVTAVGPGWAEVIAECGGVAASCKVWVPNP
jgi:hypothetical protein